MVYESEAFPDEWSIQNHDQADYLQDFDHTWLEESLFSTPLQPDNRLSIGSQKGLEILGPQRGMSLVRPQSATSETSMSSSPEEPLKKRESTLEDQKPKTKGKAFNKDESAVERRRTQVRRAQQAYRKRKDATQVSLQDECNHLHETLAKIQKTFEDFYLLSVEYNEPPRKEMEARFLLDRTARQLRFLYNIKPRNHAAVVNSKGAGITSKLSTSRESHDTETINSGEVLSNNTLSTSTHQNLPPSSEPSNSYSPTYPNNHNIAQQPQPNNPNTQPLLSDFEPCIQLGISFAARLHHEGLKRGYSLLTVKDTPYSIICRSFRFCIFSNTRDQIIKHVEELLRASVSEGQQNRCVPLDETGWLWDMDMDVNQNYQSQSQMQIQANGNGNAKTLLLAMATMPSKPRPWALEFATKVQLSSAKDSISDYMDSEAVQRHLESRGLIVQSGAETILLARDPKDEVTEGGKGNLFGELLGSRGVELSVSKLIYELLERSICMFTGPGFREADVDEAIQSTLLASL